MDLLPLVLNPVQVPGQTDLPFTGAVSAAGGGGTESGFEALIAATSIQEMESLLNIGGNPTSLTEADSKKTVSETDLAGLLLAQLFPLPVITLPTTESTGTESSALSVNGEVPLAGNQKIPSGSPFAGRVGLANFVLSAAHPISDASDNTEDVDSLRLVESSAEGFETSIPLPDGFTPMNAGTFVPVDVGYPMPPEDALSVIKSSQVNSDGEKKVLLSEEIVLSVQNAELLEKPSFEASRFEAVTLEEGVGLEALIEKSVDADRKQTRSPSAMPEVQLSVDHVQVAQVLTMAVSLPEKSPPSFSVDVQGGLAKTNLDLEFKAVGEQEASVGPFSDSDLELVLSFSNSKLESSTTEEDVQLSLPKVLVTNSEKIPTEIQQSFDLSVEGENQFHNMSQSKPVVHAEPIRSLLNQSERSVPTEVSENGTRKDLQRADSGLGSVTADIPRKSPEIFKPDASLAIAPAAETEVREQLKGNERELSATHSTQPRSPVGLALGVAVPVSSSFPSVLPANREDKSVPATEVSGLQNFNSKAFLTDGSLISAQVTVGDEMMNSGMVVDVVPQLHLAVVESVRESQSLKVELRPVELGHVKIEVVSRDGVLTASIEVERSATRHLVSENLSQLQDSLQGAGINVERIEVSMAPLPPLGDSLNSSSQWGRSGSQETMSQEESRGRQQAQQQASHSDKRVDQREKTNFSRSSRRIRDIDVMV